MARQLTIGMNEQQATATANAIKTAYANIDSKLTEVDNTMLSVAPLLSTLRTSEGWKLLDNMDAEGKTDHSSFTKFAEDYFGKSHSVISETCKVGKRFFTNGKLQDKYSGYGYTQLLRLSPLTDEEIEENGFNPEMSSVDIRKAVAEIAKAKKALKADNKKQKETESQNLTALNSAIANITGEENTETFTAPSEPEPETVDNVAIAINDIPQEFRIWLESYTEGKNPKTITITIE